MDYIVFCDESCHEALINKKTHKFIGIGSLWLLNEEKDAFNKSIKELKSKYKLNGEIKWKNVTPKSLNLYKDLIDFIFNTSEIRLRVLIIESFLIENIKFNSNDTELGFYKFYYQLLHHWIYDFNKYNIYLDYKTNKNIYRLHELKRVLINTNLTSNINLVQALHSNYSLGIQVSDFFTGLVTAKFNNNSVSESKIEIIKYLENKINSEIQPTSKNESKFNIFKINLKGGW